MSISDNGSDTAQLNLLPVDDDLNEGSNAPARGEAVRDFFGTDEIFLRVAASADEEFRKSTRLLFFSGLAAGLSIGLSFLARATITAQVPDDESGLIGNLLYPIGFLLIVLGRYQLFTENTLTPITLVLTRIASVPLLLRNWAIVLGANLVGAVIMAFFLAKTNIFGPEATEVAIKLGEHGLELSWDTLFFRAIIAGWVVASMVWLIHAARDTVSRFFIVWFLMLLIPSADLFHCIIGACEMMYLVFHGDTDIFTAFFEFFLPVLLGNTVGGVVLVGILNFSQTRETRFPDRDCGVLELTWSEWLLGFHAGAAFSTTGNGGIRLMAEDDPGGRLAKGVSPDEHIQGSTTAPITLVQYGDYECPTSREIYNLIQNLQPHHQAQFRYVYRHFPLRQQHPHAEGAAIAAEAAAAQGKFWEMTASLFKYQDHLNEDEFEHSAQEIGLNMQAFKDAMASQTHDNIFRQYIEEDRQSGIDSGVRSTRNLFINGVRYRGQWTLPALIRQLERVSDQDLSTVDLKDSATVEAVKEELS